MTDEDILKAAKPPEALPVNDRVDYTQEVATFPFSWTSGTGEVFEGDFSNHILSVEDIGTVGRAVAQLNGGMPYESIPPLHRDLHDRLGHLLVSLKSRPEWAKHLVKLKHSEIIYALYRVVETHEGIFRGRFTPEEAGTGDGNKPGA